MAERKRFKLFGRGRGESKDVSPEGIDYKALASLSRIGTATTIDKRTGAKTGASTGVSFSLIRDISLKSEVISAIIRRCVDDVIGNGYRFELADGVEKGNPADLERLRMFFKMPNPEDIKFFIFKVFKCCLFSLS